MLLAVAGSAITLSAGLDLPEALFRREIEPAAELRLGRIADGLRASQLAAKPDPAFLHLVSSVDAEPVEDGFHHGAERALAEYVRQHGANRVLVLLATANPSRMAAFVRLLGRIDGLDFEVRHHIAAQGLASKSVEVRDASMQAIESWGDASLVPLLRSHPEPVDWLASYAEQVAQDLQG